MRFLLVSLEVENLFLVQSGLCTLRTPLTFCNQRQNPILGTGTLQRGLVPSSGATIDAIFGAWDATTAAAQAQAFRLKLRQKALPKHQKSVSSSAACFLRCENPILMILLPYSHSRKREADTGSTF